MQECAAPWRGRVSRQASLPGRAGIMTTNSHHCAGPHDEPARRSSRVHEKVKVPRASPMPRLISSRGPVYDFLRNGRPVRLFTPTLRPFGISSHGLPDLGFLLLKK